MMKPSSEEPVFSKCTAASTESGLSNRKDWMAAWLAKPLICRRRRVEWTSNTPEEEEGGREVQTLSRLRAHSAVVYMA